MKCEYKYPWRKDYVCEDEALPDSKFCIFHERRTDKNTEEFHRKIIEKIEKEDFDFTGYYFPDEISFKDVKFSRDASFMGATFTGDAHFERVRFLGVANFIGTEFKEKADFDGATFTGEAKFEGAEFTGEADFEKTTFVVIADFTSTKFSKEANFMGAKFSVKFSGYAYFWNANFFGKTDFIDAHFDGGVSFAGAFFSDSTRIRALTGSALSRASFYGSNCERVDFSGSSWGDEGGDIVILEERVGALGFLALEEVYRRLKQSHQRFGDHERAGEFYYREMECRRKHQKETGQWLGYLWSEVLRRTCGYGERPYYTAFLSAGILMLWAFFYFFGGIVHTSNGSEVVINYDLCARCTLPGITTIVHDFLWALYASIITFTSLGYGDLHPIGWGRLAASIEVFIGVFLIALFLFVFTRRMIR